MEKENNKIFKSGICFAKLFVIFLIGCVFGTFYEEILHFITHREWSNRQAMIFGPFNPIYGIPAVIFILILGKYNEKRSILKTYLYSVLLGGIAEYIVGFVIETLFGVKFWDYSDYFLNIDGKTTLPFMLFWGILGVILMKIIYPFISKWLEGIPYKIAKPVYLTALIFMIFNATITYSAFGRMALRNKGIEPNTFVGTFYDKVFTNDYMKEKFPAMKINREI